MKVLNLRCTHGHGFEGWFGSEEDFESQRARALVECPICGEKALTRGLTAPRPNVGPSKAPDQPPQAPVAQPAADSPAGRWMRAMREVISQTEDVGERFAEEARRMHYGEAAERGIRGQATREQTEALLDEGIEVMPLILPDALKEPLQ